MSVATRGVRVVDVRFEHYKPDFTIGRDELKPRISWEVETSAIASFQQSAYEIQVVRLLPATQSNGDENATRVHWATVKVESPASVLVAWPCEKPLKPRDQISIRVRVWEHDSLSLWSDEFTYEAGLPTREAWSAERITSTVLVQGAVSTQREQVFRKTIKPVSTSPISKARLYLAVQGVYVAEINGRSVSADILAPGWCEFDKRLKYQTYDVKHLLESSQWNCLGIRVAEGWYCGRLGFLGGRRHRYGPWPTLIAQLEIVYYDGQSQTVSSNANWLAMPGPAVKAELYNGEKYDANLAPTGFSDAFLDVHAEIAGTKWRAVTVLDPLPEEVNLLSGWSEPIRPMEVLEPKEVFTTPSGKVAVDFGQNLVGFVRLKNIRGTKGHHITLKHAEVLENGELSLRPLRICDATDQYVCDGTNDHTWQPTFTYHGFRYCQIDGWPAEASLATSIEAVACHNDMEEVGSFACSKEILTQLFSNAKWSMRGNFFSIPTDCPQRDERLGWTGDISQFAPTATKLYNCTNFLKDWMVDVMHGQTTRGGVPPYISPDIFEDAGIWSKVLPVAIWHDVVILVPWALYQASGDRDILQRHYHSMKDWIRSIPRDKEHDSGLWKRSSFQLGDWLDPTAPPDRPMDGQTDALLVADAFLVRSLSLMSQIAMILHLEDDARAFTADATVCREHFRAEYVTPRGRLISDSQTAYSLAIVFDLLENDRQISHAGQRLATIMRRNNFRIGTGFAGTPFLCEALVRTGHTQVAYATLLCEGCPSWIYPLTMGATTMWERWDSMLPNGKVNPGEMTSFNHYCFGSVVNFLFERLAGLQCIEPGWRKIRIAPLPGGEITSASAEQLTPNGRASVHWEIVDGHFKLNVDIPAAATAEIVLPDGMKGSICPGIVVGGGKHVFSGPYDDETEWPVQAIASLPII